VSDTLNELRESARQVLAGLGLAADERKTWALAQELGWLLVAVPEDLGGLGQGLKGACAFQYELGRSLAGAPYAPALLAIDAVCRSSLAQRSDWIARLTTQQYVCTSLSDINTLATDKLNLSGVVAAVPSADLASHFLFCAQDRVALVPLQQAGVRMTHRPTWDATRRLFDLQFADVMLEETWVLARGAEAQKLSRALSTQRDLGLAADSVGGAGTLLEATVEYLRTRRQFGRPLALFQALKHRCADLKTQLAAAEALLYDSLDRIGEAPDTAEAETMARTAKQLACSMYATLAEEAVQLHGGIGMTAEHPCHLFLKRALLNQQLGRPQDTCEADLARALLGT
jgi:alkylation response protein AidB-like acyl-CoA dehydrogenase